MALVGGVETTLKRILNRLFCATLTLACLWGCLPPLTQSEPVGSSRSSCWRNVRAEHIRLHPACEACGSTIDSVAHHVLPFKKFPESECDPLNIVTLCGPGAKGHHLAIGHCYDYHFFNPNVREDARRFREMLANRKANE